MTTSSTLLNVILIKGTVATLVIFGARTLGATNVNANLQSQVCPHFAGSYNTQCTFLNLIAYCYWVTMFEHHSKEDGDGLCSGYNDCYDCCSELSFCDCNGFECACYKDHETKCSLIGSDTLPGKP